MGTLSVIAAILKHSSSDDSGGCFCGGVVLVAIVGIVILIKAIGGGTYPSLIAKGKPARGIILRVDSTGTRVSTGSNPLESRSARVDVEIPGSPAQELNATLIFPINLRGDVLPGATVELRVDPKKMGTIAVYGPGVGMPASLFSTLPGGAPVAVAQLPSAPTQPPPPAGGFKLS